MSEITAGGGGGAGRVVWEVPGQRTFTVRIPQSRWAKFRVWLARKIQP